MKTSAKNIARSLFVLSKENPKAIKEIAKDFYYYLLKRRKVKMLPFVLEKLGEVEKEETEAGEVEIESTSPLTAGQKNRIRKILKKRIIFKEKINPKLLGGIILKIDDTVFDGSIESNLERLKEDLWQIPIK